MSKRSFSDNELIEAVSKSNCLAQVCAILKLYKCGATYNILNRHIVKLNIDTGHWIESFKTPKIKKSLEAVLIKNSPYLGGTHSLKKRLLSESLLVYKCNVCGLKEWNSQTISLQLDHINGDRYDNRIENLRLLCPNCHTQTPTYGSKRFKTFNHCVDCGKGISKKGKRCKSCASKLQPTKIIWPDIEDLIKSISETSCVRVGHTLGVSDKAVKKHIKNHSKKEE